MSTILDALRKVEEEKRTQEADVRTRLLLNSSSRFDFRTRRRSRMPWVVGGGLLAVGVLLGAGMMVWRTSHPPIEDAIVAPAVPATSAAQVASVMPQQPVTPVQPLPTPASARPRGASMPGQVPDPARRPAETVTPPPQVQITPNAPGIVVPKAPHANVPASPVSQPGVATGTLGIGETFPQYDPWHVGNSQTTAIDTSAGRRGSAPPSAADVVQRSPFVSSPPDDPIVAPSPSPPPNAPRVVAAPKAAVQRPPTVEERRVKAVPSPVRRNDTAAESATARSASSSPSTQEATMSAPPGASLSFLQWSADPEKRVASIKVGTGPATLAHEGDSIEGLTIEKIRPDAVELRSGGSRYLLKAR